MTVPEFIAKWSKVELKERSAAQEHFLDLCRLVGHPTPAEADPTGETFCFEKGAAKHGGGDGFADVWMRAFSGWEYKGKHKDLEAAYDQLLRYRNALENPPLLVVCDLDRIVVHTNFTGTVSATFDIPLESLGEPRNIEILRAVFFDPEKLKPGRTSEAVTRDAADHFASIAESMRDRGLDAAHVAHFLDRIVFCLFAEDIGLLPDMIFSRIVEKAAGDPARFAKTIAQLFTAMAHGGDFGLETIRHFNGNLFNDETAVKPTADEVARIATAARMDWSAVDPTIFGTLFQRGMDPAMRAQLGAHFTGKADIDDVVENVIMRPLRAEWSEIRQIVENLLTTGKKGRAAAAAVPPNSPNPEPQTLPTSSPSASSSTIHHPPSTPLAPARPLTPNQRRKALGEADSILHQFLARLQAIKILDPACGSGNFLYVSLLKLKDLEKEVILFGMEKGIGAYLPAVGPWQLYGIEINPYAFDLAQMTVWIGWLQWIRFNGFGSPSEPILRPMTGNFRCMDAIIDTGAANDPPATAKEASVPPAIAKEARPTNEPEWPKVDFIVGNPPFLGGNRIRKELGDAYVATLFRQYAGRVPASADLCCYWFEKARAHIEKGGCKRAGLLATQGIRGGANREVLKRIKQTGDIFWAISDRDWILAGANVHVSIIAFDGGTEENRLLDGQPVSRINADLTASADITTAAALKENTGICFMGASPKAPFDIDETTAKRMLAVTSNPNGRPNSDVVRPVASGIDLVGTNRRNWTIDFAIMPMEQAAQYEAPFEYARQNVYPIRSQNRRASYAAKWWQYAEARPGMRKALSGKPRFVATPEVSKHRVFVWVSPEVLCNQQVLVFARDDDYFFGILHSRIHEVWALELGTALEDRPRYTPTTSFETFPMPWPPGQEPTTDPRYTAIAEAARALVEKRDAWLAGTDPGNKKPHTLTALYNARPTWLADAHARLDAAVSAAYAWPADISDAELLERLLAANHSRAVNPR